MLDRKLSKRRTFAAGGLDEGGSEKFFDQVIDRETVEVLREVPPVKMRKLVTEVRESFGHLLDSFA